MVSFITVSELPDWDLLKDSTSVPYDNECILLREDGVGLLVVTFSSPEVYVNVGGSRHQLLSTARWTSTLMVGCDIVFSSSNNAVRPVIAESV